MNEKKLLPSTVQRLKVARIAEMGAFLDAKTGNTSDDILLHKTQQTRDVSVGEELEVFLYLDPKKRLTASMRTPKMKVGQIARVKVINTSKDGAFLDVGAERGIFMPFAGMRGRPQVGEVVWAKLYEDKSGRLAVTMEVEDELRRASKPATNVKVGDMLSGSIYNITEKGAFMFSEERYIVFIDHKEIKERPKVGAKVTARVTFIREDGRLNASLRPPKEEARLFDADILLEELKKRGGQMPYNDSSSPLVIKEKFNMSKAAFKRALGNLLKKGLIKLEDTRVKLKQ